MPAIRHGSLKESRYEVLDVHLGDAFHVVRPAFPIMCEAGYGRHRADLIDRQAARQS